MKEFNTEQIDFNVDNVMWNRLITDKPKYIKNFMCLITK